jgi:uncharacterized protein
MSPNTTNASSGKQQESNTVTPVRRNLSFKLPSDKSNSWHREGLHVAHFFNALSIFFPRGERFFIDSVHHYRDQIDDPKLQQEVNGFIGQEAMHSREHSEYNHALKSQGYPEEKYERSVERMLKFTRRLTTKSRQLELTIALEHLTAILANRVLSNPNTFERCDPHFAQLWRWHAIEETEHKAVAFDVYREVAGKENVLTYLKRTTAFLTANLGFWPMALCFHVGLVAQDKQLFSLSGWSKAIKYFWWKPGILLKIIPEWFAYFKPGFHPWDFDNSQYLQQIASVVDAVDNFDCTTGDEPQAN